MSDLFTYCAILFAIAILLKGQPWLTGPMSPICPRQNESITLTCTDLVAVLVWRIKHDIKISFTANEEEGKVKKVGSNFTAVLVDVSNYSTSSTGGAVADLTSTLTASTTDITNGTIVTCGTWYSLQEPPAEANLSITLIFAEKPVAIDTVLEAGSNVFEKNPMQFLATLFIGHVIEYYNVSFSSGDEVILNTSESPTHLPWLHTITVTAHNCAGQSAPVTVYISHDESYESGIIIGEIPVVAGTAGVIFITLVVVASIFIYIIYVKRSKRHKPIRTLENTRSMPGENSRPNVQTESSLVPINHMSRSGIDLTNNPAYEVCQKRTNLSHMKCLSAQETEFNMDNNPLYMMVNAQK